MCLLLAVLVVYNPYMSGADSGAGLCLRHSASNRATVGASELEHFTPGDSRTVALITALAPLGILALPPAMPVPQRPRPAQKVRASVQRLTASLWFRPPPAL